MKLLSKIQFADSKIQDAFNGLNKGDYEDKRLKDWLIRAFKDLENNAFCGIQIPKRLIPQEYLEKYKVSNAWKYNLPDAWRLIYSIENNKVVVLSIVLEWMNHKDYEKRFGY